MIIGELQQLPSQRTLSLLEQKKSLLSSNGLNINNSHDSSRHKNYTNVPQNGFLKNGGKIINGEHGGNVIDKNMNGNILSASSVAVSSAASTAHSHNHNNNNPNTANMNLSVNMSNASGVGSGALVAKPAIATTPEPTSTPPQTHQLSHHPQHDQTTQQQQHSQLLLHHHHPQTNTTTTSTNGHVNGIKNLQNSVQNLAQNLLQHSSQIHTQQSQQQNSQSNTQQGNVLFYEVTPPKSNGMTEAERKVEALTKEIEKEMEEKDPIGDYFGICCACGEKVLGVIDACQAMGNLYHTNCFTCCSCGRPLRGKILDHF